MSKKAAPVCTGCGKVISGRFVSVQGRSWHEECSVCAGCGRPMGGRGYFEQNGAPYHEACFHERFSPRCAGCGQPVTGKGIQALGKHWHPEHFGCAGGGEPLRGRKIYVRDGQAYCKQHFDALFGLRCEAGGELIPPGEFIEKDGKAFCVEHYWQRFGKRCAIGSEFLKGEYVVNGWGETYCKEHAEGLPICGSCDRPICEALTGGGRRYEDGRTVCRRCRRTAVDDVAAGQLILDEVHRVLAQAGMDIDSVETPLRLVDQKELARRSTKPYAKAPAGMAWHEEATRGGEVIQRQVRAILILHGLAREHFAAIAAHELGHSFLFMNRFPDLEAMVEEGVCELAKYAWLTQQGTPEAAYRLEQMEQSEDPVYGEGFRAARRGLERKGMAGLLAYVREHRRFP